MKSLREKVLQIVYINGNIIYEMSVTAVFGKFEWDSAKAEENVRKHEIDFYTASLAFLDPKRIIAIDEKHSVDEERLFCIGRIGRRVATVRFTTRNERIRIIGAGFWRSGRILYETQRKRSK